MNEKDIIICRCEEVSYEDIVHLTELYQCSSREIKLRTRAAMGYCGGRTCRNLVDQIVSEIKNEPPADNIPLTYRPPVRPIPFRLFGGE
ncbi:(2Fe-2S)-binding protein [Aquibacillus sp. 3ASR75-11]|uniref:(2Fe-2S)-binding protein n=1 Tax=Terrihalobacillus insolitus TaxID=2950438 RepID=A0A9X3WVQ3_9BACI|nr:(2Fe-2S)-binding protein [Terrihalobacillus insolitus]MDC3425448.1 (2Fe-2S)-binding protein [Terrihalobacillus insolitus]